MCSAYCITERNIYVKFSEKRQKGSVDMERTRKGYRWNNGRTAEGAAGDQ